MTSAFYVVATEIPIPTMLVTSTLLRPTTRSRFLLGQLAYCATRKCEVFHWKFIFSKQESLAPTSHGGPPSPLRPPNSSAPAPMLPHPPHSSAPRSGHHHHRDHSSRDQASFLGKCFHQVSFPRKKSHGSVIWIRIIRSKSVKDGAENIKTWWGTLHWTIITTFGNPTK